MTRQTFKTAKGTELPLLTLKGKEYLAVAQRLVWFVEENSRYAIMTNFLTLTDTQTVAQSIVHIYDETGKIVKSASAVKRETQDNFSDHTEKAETGSIGRALAMLGYGTQFSSQDLDEGDRLADAPVAAPVRKSPTPTAHTNTVVKGTFKNATNALAVGTAQVVSKEEEF